MIAALFVLLTACSEASLDAGPLDAGADDADADTLVEKVDGAFCPPPLGTPAPRPVARPPAGPLDDVLRMNHLQAKATHNSYHVQKPDASPDLAYGHQPIDVQLEAQGVRALELDVHFDYECLRHEVFHLPIVDDASTCRHFTECLGALRRWSDAHLGHHPIFVQIETKDSSAVDAEERIDVLEREILSVFPREAIVTPDEVQGDAPSLASAVANGWPTLAKTRGRVVFYLLASGPLRDVYTHEGKDLAGRLMFVTSSVGEPLASIALVDDPIGGRATIDEAVAAGMIVRTFAEKLLALDGAPEQSRAALESGAQILATDFPAKTTGAAWSFENPGSPSRCNPKTAPASCRDDAIESPDRLTTPE